MYPATGRIAQLYGPDSAHGPSVDDHSQLLFLNHENKIQIHSHILHTVLEQNL